MSRSSPRTELIYPASADTVLFRKRQPWDTFGSGLSNLGNLFVSEASHPVGFAFGHSFSFGCVSHVVSLSAKVQVFRQIAGRIVAIVKHRHAIRDSANEQFIGDSVSDLRYATTSGSDTADEDVSVSEVVGGTRELSATVGSHFTAFEQSFFEWCDLVWHTFKHNDTRVSIQPVRVTMMPMRAVT